MNACATSSRAGVATSRVGLRCMALGAKSRTGSTSIFDWQQANSPVGKPSAKKLTITALRSAIAEFEKGDWRAKSKQFAICTSSSIQDVKLQLEIETQRTRLMISGIDLQVRGQTELSAELKEDAALVRDFFGRSWVPDFCANAAVEHEARLDADEVALLRRELRTLYASNFSTLDPGIVGSAVGDSGSEGLPLLSRFVEPDVELISSTTRFHTTVSAVPDGQNDRNTSDLPQAPTPPSLGQRGEDILRLSVSAWAAAGENAILSADGGLGKSTCLRAFALDQLDDGGRFPSDR